MSRVWKKILSIVLAIVVAFGASNVCISTDAYAAVKASKMNVSVSKKTLYIGWTNSKKTAKINVKLKPSGASKDVTFKSSNKKVAKVSDKGKVTAVKAGNVTITVTSKSNKKLKKKIKFTVKNYKLTFASNEQDIYLKGDADTTSEELTLYGVADSISFTSSNEDVASVDGNGRVTAKRMGSTIITAVSSKGEVAECNVNVLRSNIAIHDPSVYHDPISGKYYSFGSHIMAAVSTNLIGWSSTAGSGNNYSDLSTLFSKNYKEEFAEPYAFTMPNGASQNAWAPDIIYNTSMKKYCMYISIVDGSTKCCIAMAVADKPDGPYSYKGMIVCSGLKEDGSDVDKTNIAEALGITDAEAKSSKYASLGHKSPDCIDATVFYDHEGKLWMVYGSFTTTGGIRLLKLNPDTGLRGDNYTDSGDGSEDVLSTDDPYYGRKIANSNGEGPYIQMIANEKSSTGYYYYLWTSVGNLQYYGGYNMRVVRAERPEGPYYDTKGNDAAKDLQKYALGLRVMDNYKFSFMDSAKVSQGGNSATDDGNGKTFIQFHERTSVSDSFTFRTHQTFVNEDGWLVTAPYEYNGENIEESYNLSDVAGDYEFIYHRDTFAKTTISNMDYIESQRLSLNSDGTVSGAYIGSWELKGHYITIKISDKTYKGVVLEQYEQTTNRDKVMVFTAVGDDNRSIWGSKIHKSDADAVESDVERIEMPVLIEGDFKLETKGLFGSDISWSSDNEALWIDNDVARAVKDSKEVILTAIASRGSSSASREFTVQVVAADKINIPSVVVGDSIELPEKCDDVAIKWSSSDENIVNVNGTVNRPEKGYKIVTLTAEYGDIKENFDVIVFPSQMNNVIYSEDYSDIVNDAKIETVWTSVDKQNCLYVEADETHDSFIKFAAGNTSSSQGAKSDFGVAENTGNDYIVEFDVALDAGTRETTEFAITGTDVNYKDNNSNAGLESGYILKLSSEDDLNWKLNDIGESFELPLGWVHVETIVDKASNKAAVVISDNNKVYYSGEVKINGNGNLNGLYLRWGCVQALVSVDNVKVCNSK